MKNRNIEELKKELLRPFQDEKELEDRFETLSREEFIELIDMQWFIFDEEKLDKDISKVLKDRGEQVDKEKIRKNIEEGKKRDFSYLDFFSYYYWRWTSDKPTDYGWAKAIVPKIKEKDEKFLNRS